MSRRNCINCGKPGPHYVPPSLGEPGFFVCEASAEVPSGDRMLKPRNTLVVLELIEQPTKQVGKLTVPTNNELYTEAEVIAVGPGTVAADGGRSETFDLKVGQRVWVKHKERRHAQMPPELVGLPYRDGDKLYHVFEQGSIVGIIAEPGVKPPLLN